MVTLIMVTAISWGLRASDINLLIRIRVGVIRNLVTRARECGVREKGFEGHSNADTMWIRTPMYPQHLGQGLAERFAPEILVREMNELRTPRKSRECVLIQRYCGPTKGWECTWPVWVYIWGRSFWKQGSRALPQHVVESKVVYNCL